MLETAIFQRKDLSLKHIDTVFHQLLKHIPRYRFDRVVERYEGHHLSQGIFLEIMFWLIQMLQSRLPSSNEIVWLIDFTTLELNLHHYAWAKILKCKRIAHVKK